MRLNPEEARARFAEARHAYLATADERGYPHLVPITFASQADIVVTAVDHKPKRGPELRRLRNIAVNPHVSLLADEYQDDDWRRLWWVRADGQARVLSDAERAVPVDWLRERYWQYRERAPEGPVIWIAVHTWRGWSYE